MEIKVIRCLQVRPEIEYRKLLTLDTYDEERQMREFTAVGILFSNEETVEISRGVHTPLTKTHAGSATPVKSRLRGSDGASKRARSI